MTIDFFPLSNPTVPPRPTLPIPPDTARLAQVFISRIFPGNRLIHKAFHRQLTCIFLSHQKTLDPLAAMCFPSKSQKNNFSDKADSKPKPTPSRKESTDKAIKAESASSSNPPPAAPVAASTLPTNATPATQEATTMSAPKVAIVIYSMYGHIAKCKSCFILLAFI